MRVTIPSILLLWLCAGAGAADDKPDISHFKYTMRLLTPGRHPVYRMPLPREVYQGIQTPGAGDLRVFNADGVAVPYALRTPGPKQQTRVRPVSLPFFPITPRNRKSTARLTLLLNTSSTGKLSWAGSTPPAHHGDKPEMYIIDASRLSEPVSVLQIDWENSSRTQVFAVTLEYSDDLKSWRHAGRESLARLDYKGHSLVRDKIHLPARKAKYFRLRWPQTQAAIRIRSVKALMRTHSRTTMHTRYWHRFEMQRVQPAVSDRRQQGFVYFRGRIGALIPLDRLRLHLPDDNMVLKLSVVTRESAWSLIRDRQKIAQQTRFRPLWQGLVYRISTPQRRLVSRDIRFAPVETREVYLRIPAQNLPPGLLTINAEAGWRARQLLFIAQGKRPYTLAYGASQVRPSKFDFDSLHRLISRVHGDKLLPGPAAHRPPVLNPDHRPVTPPAAPGPEHRDRHRRLLWTVLTIAVTLLGLMAYRVGRQLGRMNKSD